MCSQTDINPMEWPYDTTEQTPSPSEDSPHPAGRSAKEEELWIKAENTVLNMLAFSSRSEHQLREKLQKKEYPQEIVDGVLRKAFEAGLIDDQRFASEWVNARKSNRGASALRFELRNKGIPDDLIEEVLNNLEEEQTETNYLRELAEKKASTYPKTLDVYKRKQRLIGFLARRGFPASEVYQVVNDIVFDTPEETEQ